MEKFREKTNSGSCNLFFYQFIVYFSHLHSLFPENMDIILITKTHLYEKDGHVFYNITGTNVDYTLTGLKVRLDNLFDGVKALGMAVIGRKISKSANFFLVQISF